tara:strand:- start:1081 stop:5517 length:4437 start_codon:yes stop_codon:yes gene_type:complete
MHPISVINYSKLYLNNMNIYDRVNLHNVDFIESFFLDKNKFIPRYNIIENEDEFDSTFKKMKIINTIVFKEENRIEDRRTNETYVDFLNKMIPTTKSIFLSLIKNKLQLDKTLSYHKIIDYLEPFLIYNNHITYKQYEQILNFVEISCNNYLKRTIKNVFDMNMFMQLNMISYKVPSRLLNFFDKKDELEKMDKKWYSLNDDISPNEYIKQIISADNGRLLNDGITLSGVALIQTIDIDNKLNELKEKLDNDREKFLSDRENNCNVFTLAKRFKNIDELSKDKSESVFDKEYDDTRYDIYDELSHIKNINNKEERKKTLSMHLMTEMGISARNAERDSDAMVNGFKKVIDGDYAVLDMGDYDYRYYIRKSNKWHLDNEFNGKFIDEVGFCNVQKNCLNINKSCTSKEEGKLMMENELISDIMNNIEVDFKENIDKLIDQIKNSLQNNMKNMITLKKYNYNKFLKYDNEKYLFSEMLDEDIEFEVSPYITLRDMILGQNDIIKKYDDILKFIEMYCTYKYTEGVENIHDKYWYYCNETNLILLPTFYKELAEAFKNDNYKSVLDNICKERGTLSDNGDKIVDKYSGHIIKNINYENVEMYEKSGKKIISHEILDLTIDEIRKEEEDEILKEEKAEYKTETAKLIVNILETFDKNLGINVSNYYPNIVRIVTELIDKKLSSVKIYNEKRKKAAKEGKKMQKYDKAFNKLIIYFTISCYIIIIQSSIPHIIKGKGFHGCKESFIGYPFEKSKQYGIIEYITCVALKLAYKTSDDGKMSPWTLLPKLTKKNSEKKKKDTVERITKYIKEIFLKIPEIISLMKKKQLWLEKNEVITMEDILADKWQAFLPILETFELTKLNDVGSSFESSLIKSYKDGNKNYLKLMGKLYGKIIKFSLSFQSSMQKIIDKQPLILKSLGDVHFLENACCDDNSNVSSYEYFINKSDTIEKYNIITNKLTNMYNKFISLQTPLFNSLEDTKIYHKKHIEEFDEKTIYTALMKYCYFNSGIELDNKLKQVCINNISEYTENDTLEEKIKILKNEGHNYSNASLKLLLKILHKENIVKNKTVDENFHPKNTFEKQLKYMNEKNEKIDYIELITSKLEEIFDRHESHYKDSRDEDIDELTFLLKKTSNKLKENLIENLKKVKKSKKAIAFINELDDYADKGDNIFMKIEDESGYFNHIMLLNMVEDITNIFPNIILKKMNYQKKAIRVPDHWKLSINHQSDVKNIISQEFITLKKFYGNEKLESILKKIQIKTIDIIEFVKKIPFFPEFLDYKTICNGKLIYNLTKFILLAVSSLYYKIVDEMYDENNIDRIIRGEKTAIYNNVSLLLVCYYDIFSKNKKILNKSNKTIMEEVLKAKDKEKTHITKTYEDLTREQRKVVKVMQNHKLGDWSLGESKAVYMYDPNQYDKEREHIEKMAIMELNKGIKDDVTGMLRDVYDMDDIFAEQQIEARIQDEKNNISHLPDDDDYGDFDGDEFD